MLLLNSYINIFSLTLQIWGVDIVSGNAVAWLECVAKGQKVTLKPIGRENNDLYSTVLLHLPKKQVNNNHQHFFTIIFYLCISFVLNLNVY